MTALRQVRRDPVFSAIAIATLALGIGATTAIFGAVNPILIEALPYPDAGRIAMIWDYSNDSSRLEPTFGTYRELAARSRSFDALAVMRTWQPTMTGPTEPERLDGQRVSASYFRVLGVAPVLGRDFEPSDDRLASAKVAILSYGLWQRRFALRQAQSVPSRSRDAGEPTVIGRQIMLDGSAYTVVGVMPRGFENVLAPSAELWTPLQYDMSLGVAWGHHLRMAGRLRPGTGLDQARRELDAIAHARVPEFPRMPWATLAHGLIVHSLQDEVTRGVKPALAAVFGAVALVLVIACVNVTNLLLARGAQRRGEFAVRAALGAGRARLIRQLVTESLLLALLGGVLGVAVAALGVRALVALSPPGMPRVDAIGIDATVFAFAFGITTLVGLLVGVIPAVHASRDDLQAGLHHSSRSIAGHHLTRRILVVAEVALALVLLVSAGLLLRSLRHLFAVAPGFDASHLLTMQVQTSGRRFDDDAVTFRFFADALSAVRRVPGVTAAAFTSQLPLSGDYELYGVHFESSPTGRPDADRGAFRYAVSPGYIETMAIPLRAGRLLDARDTRGAPAAVLINDSLAARKFPGVNPIGQRLRVGPNDGPWSTIVGVVGDVKQASLALDQPDAVYTIAEQGRFADGAMSFVIRGHGDATALIPAIRNAIWSVDKDQPIVRIAMMDDLVAKSAAERRFAAVLFEAFALVALVLAATGVYGVLAGRVAERTREIGVRAALGASRRDLLALVIREAMTLTALGAAIGVAGAIAATRAIVAMLFGVARLDPVTYLGVIAIVAAASTIACALPAWRAARIDPAIALRAE